MQSGDMGLEPGKGTPPAPEHPAPTPPAPVISPENKGGDKGDAPPTPPTPPAPAPKDDTPPVPEDPKDQRINSLMSKWQTEEHGRKTAEEELAAYRAKFGALDGAPTTPSRASPPAPASPGNDDPDVPAALKTGWQPRTMEELQDGLREVAAFGAKMAMREIEGRTQSEAQARAEADRILDEFVSQVKGADPEFNDKAFFDYAAKYRFPLNSLQDLRSVYTNFVDNNRAIRDAEKRGAEKREGRQTPVGKPGAGGPGNGGMPYSKISGAASAADLVRDALHGK